MYTPSYVLQDWRVPWFICVFGISILIYHVIKPRKWKPSEPPVIPSLIPYVGHPLNMFLHGGRYLRMLGRRYPRLPIFTLPAVTSRIYIVTSPVLAAEVQRRKTLAFDPLVPDLTQRVLGMDNETAEMMRRNVDRNRLTGGQMLGAVPDMHDSVAAWMGVGSVLDELTESAVGELTGSLNAFGTSLDGKSSTINLLEWTQHIYTACTAKFMYGPLNPIALDPSLESAFWDFDHGVGALLLGIWPLNRKPLAGREKLVEAFKEYLWKGNQSQASTMIKKRYEVLQRHGFSLDGMARSELSFLFAGIINTTVSSFWTVLRIFADPALLKSIRDEIIDAHSTFDVEDDEGRINLRLTLLKSSCPLLSATFKESLRLSSDLSSTRLVTSDTELSYKSPASGETTTFSLFKDTILQISGAAMHSDPNIYGDDAFEFNPYRFLDKERKVHPAAFRGFGGGSTLCPGRHLAGSEVLAWTAAVVMGCDIEAPIKGDKLTVPPKEDGRLPVHVCEPKTDVRVKMTWKGRKVEVLSA